MKTYRIKRVLNHNAIVAVHGFVEVIITGPGVGFQVRKHDKVEPQRIEKVFKLEQDSLYQTSKLIESMPDDFVVLMQRVITGVSKSHGVELDHRNYFSIMDHVYFAIERYESGTYVPNFMLSDLKFMYPDEYAIAVSMLDAINVACDVALPEDELGFLTMHIINGLHADAKIQSQHILDMIFYCLNIIRDAYLIPLKMDQVETQRTVMHVKMLVQRMIDHVQIDNEDAMLYNVVIEFERAFKVTDQIRIYLESQLQLKMNPQELVYLTIHIRRLESLVQK